MKISIVTVCYNSAATLRETIESVLAQDYDNIEYIVVDGGSSDASLEIIRSYGERIDSVISEPDHGIYDAMNKGIKIASGDFVGTLNSDDLFASTGVISNLVEFLMTNPGLDASYGDLVFVKRDDPVRVTRSYSSKRFSVGLIRFGIMFPHPTFYARTELFHRLGFYKLDYRVSADFELLARFVNQGIVLSRNAHLMVKMREGGISTTGIWGRIHQNFEIVRACRENGIYTNILLVAMKIPVKLAGLLLR